MSASVDQFAAFCATMTLDSGKAWEVEPFELDIVADILAGVPETWALLPEGNGKTTLLAGVALFHLLTVPRARAVVAAAASLQARILYDQAAGFVRDSPELSRRVQIREGSLELRTAGGGRLKVYSADDRVADGAIFTLAILDELHAHRGLGLYRTWGGKLSKRGGQLVVLSTSGEPGTEFEELRSRLHTESPDVRRVGRYTRAAGPRHALHDWALEPTDDPDDLAIVKLANPLSTVTLDVLAAKREQAGYSVGHWLQRTCNRSVRVVESWISEQEWMRARSPRTIPEGVPITLGVDWGWITDATAIVPLYCADGSPMLLGPATVLYAPAGDGLQLDPEDVRAALLALAERNPIVCVAHDSSAGAGGHLMGDFLANTLRCDVVEVGQGVAMADAAGMFLERLRTGELQHTGDATLTRHMLNGKRKPVGAGAAFRLIRPHESRDAPHLQKSREIDAAVAALMAVYATAQPVPPEPFFFTI